MVIPNVRGAGCSSSVPGSRGSIRNSSSSSWPARAATRKGPRGLQAARPPVARAVGDRPRRPAPNARTVRGRRAARHRGRAVLEVTLYEGTHALAVVRGIRDIRTWVLDGGARGQHG